MLWKLNCKCTISSRKDQLYAPGVSVRTAISSIHRFGPGSLATFERGDVDGKWHPGGSCARRLARTVPGRVTGVKKIRKGMGDKILCTLYLSCKTPHTARLGRLGPLDNNQKRQLSRSCRTRPSRLRMAKSVLAVSPTKS